MKRLFYFLFFFLFAFNLKAQTVYTMGYDHIQINVVDPHFFSIYQIPDATPICGIYDRASETFYTCQYETYRYINEDFVIQNAGNGCCDQIDFDPRKYYGTLTLKGVIEKVEWDSLLVYFKTDKARLVIKTDENEIDMLYKKFYKENYLGSVNIVLNLKAYDTPKEDILSYNKNTEKKIKPVRKQVRILRW
ncbi:MAG TPA: hypothetical protein PKA54_02800 [Chitinophagaceae bacterium]|nr:MAG: hypothetical protein UZ11_BCD004000945 [Bacteroidetes bacterium OLB11]HMN32280.1 hypothetical protein [Chitinophagaceae bacterium]